MVNDTKEGMQRHEKESIDACIDGNAGSDIPDRMRIFKGR